MIVVTDPGYTFLFFLHNKDCNWTLKTLSFCCFDVLKFDTLVLKSTGTLLHNFWFWNMDIKCFWLWKSLCREYRACWTNKINYYANQSICPTCKIHGCWCYVPNETYRNLCMSTQRSWEFENNSLWWSHTLIFHIKTKVWSPLTIHTVTYFKTDEIIYISGGLLLSTLVCIVFLKCNSITMDNMSEPFISWSDGNGNW